MPQYTEPNNTSSPNNATGSPAGANPARFRPAVASCAARWVSGSLHTNRLTSSTAAQAQWVPPRR